MNDPVVEARVKRLLSYLEQISPDGSMESARDELQSATAGSLPDDAETLQSLSAPSDDGHGLETLDSLVRDRESASVTHDNLDELEAIIHKTGRPAIDIMNDSYSAPGNGEWRELGIGDTRKRIESCIPSIGRIEVPNDLRGRPYAGTGFVVGENLLMTNRHVARIFANGTGLRDLRFEPGQTAAIDFKREIPRSGSPDPVLLEIRKIEMIHPLWDMALLRVEGLPSRHAVLELSTKSPDEHSLLGAKVVAIGYPARDDRRNNASVQDRIFNNIYEVKRMLPGKMTGRQAYERRDMTVNAASHDCSTLGGNSGSAVINIETGQVVALHFAGEYLKTNYAVAMYDLAADSRVVDAGVNFTGAHVPPDRELYNPIWASINSHEAVTNVADQTGSDNGGAIDRTVTGSVGSNGSIDFTIPLRVSISLGEPLTVSDSGLARAVSNVKGSAEEGVLSFITSPFARGRSKPEPADTQMHRFAPTSLSSEGFNWSAALSAALASSLAYKNADQIVDTAKTDFGFERCEYVDSGNIECFLAWSGAGAILSFRGSEKVKADWLTNFDIFPVKQAYGKVHGGFLDGFQAVKGKLESLLAPISEQPIVFTGHSLGGALATIAAAEWHDNYPPATIYTFGQPAVGRMGFRDFFFEQYPGRFFRFVNSDDLVAMLPPNYKHVGKLIHFDDDGHTDSILQSVQNELSDLLLLGDTMSEEMLERLRNEIERELSAGARSSESDEEFIPSVRDHSMDLYVENIGRKEAKLT